MAIITVMVAGLRPYRLQPAGIKQGGTHDKSHVCRAARSRPDCRAAADADVVCGGPDAASDRYKDRCQENESAERWFRCRARTSEEVRHRMESRQSRRHGRERS